ncbi:MAG: phosphatase PAP2 family protein [Planctomycetes bacterium]|nr:phosphatase PAP2 family protein [Planctomycetota bacterium]
MSSEEALGTDRGDRIAGRTERIRVIRPVWRPRALVLSHLVALLLVVTWITPATRQWWDRFDLALFRLLNDSLALGHGWQVFWAVANYRALDLLPAVLILGLFIVSIWGRPRDVQNQRWAVLAVLGGVLVVVPPLMELVVHQGLQYSRPSPTLVLDDALRLSHLVPSINTKDTSRACFPGDHAYVLLTVMSFFWYVGRRRDALLASLLAAVFVLPRLVGGAHWATDILVGGGPAALLAGSWAFATPLCHRLATLLHPLVCAVMKLVPGPLRIPEWPERLADDAPQPGSGVIPLSIDRDPSAPPQRKAG